MMRVPLVARVSRLLRGETNAILLRNISGTLLIKGAAVLISVLMTPAYLRFLDDHTMLGAWFTIVAVLNWMLTFDLGIGNGLRNRLVQALVSGDDAVGKRYVSSAYVVMGAAALAVALGGSFLLRALDWNAVLNVPSSVVPAETLVAVVRVVFIGTVLQLWLRLVTSILYAMQKTALSNSLALVSAVGLLIFVLTYRGADSAGRLLALAMAQVVAVNTPLIVATVVLFATTLRKQRPSLKSWDRTSAKAVTNLGGMFFAIQLALLVMNSTNELLIGGLYSAADVVEYQIHYKFFYVIVSVFALFTQPIWSAITKAHVEGRYQWIRKVYVAFTWLSLAGTAAALLLVAAMPTIVKVWLGEYAIPVRTDFLLVFAALVAVTLFVNSATCIANGLGRLRPQIVFTIVGAAAKVPLAYLLSGLVSSWISVVMANLLVMVPLLIAQTWHLRNVFRRDWSLE
ncbi:MAG: polysaccharide biosynthesis protein [Coriobacteriia bacterium]